MKVKELVEIVDGLEIVSIVADGEEVLRGRAGHIQDVLSQSYVLRKYADYQVEKIEFGFPTKEDNAVWNTMIIHAYEMAEVKQIW